MMNDALFPLIPLVEKFSVQTPRRMFFLAAAVVMAAGGVVAAVTASAGVITSGPSNTFVAKRGDKCLTASDRTGRLVQRSCSPADAIRQTFQITPAAGGYTIGLLAGGCLGLPDGERPELVAACDGAADLTFSLLLTDDGRYAFQNDQTGLCLEVPSTADEAAVIAAVCGDADSQGWQVKPPTSPSPSAKPAPGTPSATPTRAAPTASATPRNSLSATPSVTPSATPSATASATASATPSATTPGTHSATPRVTTSATPSASSSTSPSASASATPRATTSATPSTTPTASASATPSASPSATTSPAPSATPSATTSPAPSTTPSATTSPAPGATPSATPSATATAAPAADCTRPAGTAPQVRITEVNVGLPVTGYGREGDTEPLPMAIAATPDGGSWLAWLGTDSKVHLGRLDCDDRLVGTVTSFEGIDLQDVQADANGGVLLLTRPGDCHTGPLCGGESSPCNTMHMIRFDDAGQLVWERQVTNLTDSRGGYDDGARFIWWYQHHGRLAWDGSNYAAYFGVAITVRNGNCVDIHEGDRMQVVDAQGDLVSGHDSFDVGCSHAWTSRIVWDPRTGHFVMVCATDNNCRIAQPNPYRTLAAGTCDGTLFGGDLVLAKTQGYWTAWSQGGQVRLEHFTTGASDTTVRTAAASGHPHLVGYGTDSMLLAWESGSSMLAQVHDATTGAAVGDQFPIAARDHAYQAFKPYADGSAAYPAAGSTSTAIKIARVMPLTR